MKNVRTIVKSHQRKIRNLFEQVIFPRLGESYKIADFETKIPTILFLEDNDSVQETIAIVKSKAVALTSLSNTYQILKTAIEGTASAEGVVNKDSENGNVKAVKKTKTKTGTDPESDIQTKIIDEMEKLLLNTIQNFNISSDTNPLNVEDSDKSVENSLYSREVNNTKYAMNVKPALEFGLLSNAYTKFSITEKAETLDEYEILKDKLELAFSIFKNGKTVIDKKTDKVLELEDFSTYKKYLGEIELSIKENKLEL